MISLTRKLVVLTIVLFISTLSFNALADLSDVEEVYVYYIFNVNGNCTNFIRWYGYWGNVDAYEKSNKMLKIGKNGAKNYKRHILQPGSCGYFGTNYNPVGKKQCFVIDGYDTRKQMEKFIKDILNDGKTDIVFKDCSPPGCTDMFGQNTKACDKIREKLHRKQK